MEEGPVCTLPSRRLRRCRQEGARRAGAACGWKSGFTHDACVRGSASASAITHTHTHTRTGVARFPVGKTATGMRGISHTLSLRNVFLVLFHTQTRGRMWALFVPP